jgi:hypothetical protein
LRTIRSPVRYECWEAEDNRRPEKAHTEAGLTINLSAAPRWWAVSLDESLELFRNRISTSLPLGCNEETARQAKVLTDEAPRWGNRCSTLGVSPDRPLIGADRLR